MIDCLIFSKDRACQLEFLLRSIKDNFSELNNVNIIYKASDDLYADGYKILMNTYSNHNWIREGNLVQDIKSVVNSFTSDVCLTLVDDEVVIHDFDVNYLNGLPEYVHCISLRLNTSVDYTYTANIPSPPPTFETIEIGDNKLYKWDWTQCHPHSDWGYPSCINSHLYRTSFLKHWINTINFNGVNNLEGMLNNMRSNFSHHMCCFEKSKTISVANNLTQTGQNRHSNKDEYSIRNLNEQFLNGKRIDSSNFYGIDTNLATLERDYIWNTNLK